MLQISQFNKFDNFTNLEFFHKFVNNINLTLLQIGQ